MQEPPDTTSPDAGTSVSAIETALMIAETPVVTLYMILNPYSIRSVICKRVSLAGEVLYLTY
jgi:hypothetical protein